MYKNLHYSITGDFPRSAMLVHLDYVPTMILQATVATIRIGFFRIARALTLNSSAKPGLHEPQLPVERSVTLVSSIVVVSDRV